MFLPLTALCKISHSAQQCNLQRTLYMMLGDILHCNAFGIQITAQY